MTPTEQKAGWLLSVTGAAALVFLFFVESFSISKLVIGYFWLSSTALNSLVICDLFHRHDLTIRRGTILSVIAWIVPCASWVLFIMHRNLPRPISSAATFS